MPVDNPFTNGQTDAVSALALMVATIKNLKDRVDIFLFDPDPVIDKHNGALSTRLATRNLQFRIPRVSILDRVLDQFLKICVI